MSGQTNEFEIWVTEEKENKEERRKQNKITNESLEIIVRKVEGSKAETRKTTDKNIKQWRI